eukprot:g18730.t1
MGTLAATAAPAVEHGDFGGVAPELLEPLERAAGSGDAEATTSLLTKGSSLHVQAAARPLRRTVLHWTAWGGNTETSSLHLASERGHVEVAATLLNIGVSADLLDGYERTALDVAADADNEEMMVAQVAGGADINAARNHPAHTPTHRAVFNNNLAMFEHAALEDRAKTLLVDTNFRIALDEVESRSSPGYMGVSPLYLVALVASEGGVRVLLSAGANECVPALDRKPRNYPYSEPPGPLVRTLPSDVVGKWVQHMPKLRQAEIDRRVAAVRAMLARASL